MTGSCDTELATTARSRLALRARLTGRSWSHKLWYSSASLISAMGDAGEAEVR
jgi:hypothetical protein